MFSQIRASITGTRVNLTAIGKKRTCFQVRSRFDTKWLRLVDALVLPKVSSYVPPAASSDWILPHLQGLELTDPTFMEHSRIEVLLGMEEFAQLVLGEAICIK